MRVEKVELSEEVMKYKNSKYEMVKEIVFKEINNRGYYEFAFGENMSYKDKLIEDGRKMGYDLCVVDNVLFIDRNMIDKLTKIKDKRCMKITIIMGVIYFIIVLLSLYSFWLYGFSKEKLFLFLFFSFMYTMTYTVSTVDTKYYNDIFEHSTDIALNRGKFSRDFVDELIELGYNVYWIEDEQRYIINLYNKKGERI